MPGLALGTWDPWGYKREKWPPSKCCMFQGQAEHPGNLTWRVLLWECVVQEGGQLPFSRRWPFLYLILLQILLHFLIYLIVYVFLITNSSWLECKLLDSRKFYLCQTPLHSHGLEQCLAHSWSSRIICWMNEWTSELCLVIHYWLLPLWFLSHAFACVYGLSLHWQVLNKQKVFCTCSSQGLGFFIHKMRVIKVLLVIYFCVIMDPKIWCLTTIKASYFAYFFWVGNLGLA